MINHDVCEICDERCDKNAIRLKVADSVCVTLCSFDCCREYLDNLENDEENEIVSGNFECDE
jgi:hypothetical protein